MLLSSMCEKQQSAVWFWGLKGITQVKFSETCVACMGKTVWTVATSPGGEHSSRQNSFKNAHHLEMVLWSTIFPLRATHVPVNFTQVMPVSPQNSHWTSLPQKKIIVHYFLINPCILIHNYCLFMIHMSQWRCVVKPLEQAEYFHIRKPR